MGCRQVVDRLHGGSEVGVGIGVREVKRIGGGR